MAVIKKKIWSQYFQKVLDGKKTCEVRLNDDYYQNGDKLLLEEYDNYKGEKTGRSVTKIITDILYIRSDSEICFGSTAFAQVAVWTLEDQKKFGLVILSIK